MIQMFLSFLYFSTNLDIVYLCLPLLTFVYLCLPFFTIAYLCLPLFTLVHLCSNDASMHKFCVCFETPFICNYQHLLLIFPFLTEWFSDNKKCWQNTIYTEFFNKFSSIENYCTFTKPSNAIKLSEYNTWYI